MENPIFLCGWSYFIWIAMGFGFSSSIFLIQRSKLLYGFQDYLGEGKLEEKIQIQKIKQLKRKYKLLKDRIGKVFNEAHVKRL